MSEGKAHLRIENRVLPSGSTVLDEVANAAFFTGLMAALPEKYGAIDERMTFDDARRGGRHIRHAEQVYGLSRWPDGTPTLPHSELERRVASVPLRPESRHNSPASTSIVCPSSARNRARSPTSR